MEKIEVWLRFLDARDIQIHDKYIVATIRGKVYMFAEKQINNDILVISDTEENPFLMLSDLDYVNHILFPKYKLIEYDEIYRDTLPQVISTDIACRLNMCMPGEAYLITRDCLVRNSGINTISTRFIIV